MSTKHPVIAVTGSSGAGTSTVMKSFAHIFRREGIQPQIIEGDSFHRYDRVEMRARVKAADTGEGPQISHFGPESNLLGELAASFEHYGTTGQGKVRRYVHDDVEAKELGSDPGTFTDWTSMAPDSDLLFYEGLHGGVKTDTLDVAQYTDLLIGVAPILNLEWIQKIHRDTALRGYKPKDVTKTILRRMEDYVKVITPQFSETGINFQRVPLVDTSNPFIARDVPTPEESLVIIRFNDKHKFSVDFGYLLAMIRNSFMSRYNSIVIPGGMMGLAMECIFRPIIEKMLGESRRLRGVDGRGSLSPTLPVFFSRARIRKRLKED
jgi:phosphoribulokinase